MSYIPNLVFENATLKFVHLNGQKHPKFDPQGLKKSFSIVIDPTINNIDELRRMGWKIEEYSPEGADWTEFSLKVQVRYTDKGGPSIQLYYPSDNHLVGLDAETCGCVDTLPIQSADVVVRAYEYEPGKISAYCNELIVTIKEGPFTNKYRDAIRG